MVASAAGMKWDHEPSLMSRAGFLVHVHTSGSASGRNVLSQCAGAGTLCMAPASWLAVVALVDYALTQQQNIQRIIGVIHLVRTHQDFRLIHQPCTQT